MGWMAAFKNVSVGYGRRIVVDGIELEIPRGEILSLIGPNGAGKSTVLRSVGGQLALLGGSVEVDGRSLQSMGEKERARKMSVLLTERIHPELMTCREVAAAGRYPFTGRMGRLTPEDEQKVEEAMALLKVTAIGDRDFEEVSDGQRQRVLLARAICQEPELLLLDEPTSYLDIRHKYELLEILRQLSAQGMTVVMSLHEIELALRVSTRLLCVKDGRADWCGTPQQILQSGRIRELFALTPAMYEALLGGIRGFTEEGRDPGGESRNHGTDGKICNVKNESRDAGNESHYNYFSNRECEYFPCHETSDPEEFNCLFCYCPLYRMGDACGGNYRISERGIKDCTGCLLPHKRSGYKYINDMLRKWNKEQEKRASGTMPFSEGTGES